MSLQFVRDGLHVDLAAHLATGTFEFDGLADLPARGDAVDWVAVDGDAIGAHWYADEVRLELARERLVRVTARQPGYDWTWIGLAPIEGRGSYRLYPSLRNLDGEAKEGYWAVFSNWSDDDAWSIGEADPLRDSLKTWEVEFLSATAHDGWLHHANGTWPTGLTPPAGTASGLYLCVRLAIEVEPEIDCITGSATTLYRHFAVFQEAPAIGGTQLEWARDIWS